MTLRIVTIALVLLFALAAFSSQLRPRGRENDDGPRRLPGGRNQTEEILKADHAKSLEDAGELMKLSEELKIELEKNDRHVLSLSAIKKTEEIEKLAKRIRSRLKRY